MVKFMTQIDQCLISLLNANYLKTIDMGIVKDNRKDLAQNMKNVCQKAMLLFHQEEHRME